MKLWNGRRYYSLDCCLKERFGEKLYKLSLNGGMTCPNRDGKIATGGCIFCSEGGSGEFSAPPADIQKQIDYYESAKIYKVVVDIILKALRKDDHLRDRMTVISFMHKYNSDNTLQLGELLLSFKTTERFDEDAIDYDDEDWIYDIICSIKGYVGEEDGEEERRKERS